MTTCGVLLGRCGLGGGGGRGDGAGGARARAGIRLLSLDGGFVGASSVAAKAAREMLRITKTSLLPSIASELQLLGGANIGEAIAARDRR